MGSENGQRTNAAIAVIRHIKERFSSTSDVTYQATLTALAHVYRSMHRSPVDNGIKSILLCEKDVHQLTESDFLEAVRIVFQPEYPIVYPDQFRSVMIIHPDGTVLWMEPAAEPKKAAPSEPASPVESTDDAPA